MSSIPKHIVFFAFFSVVVTMPVLAQEMSAAQKEVWDMEEAYWRDIKTGNEAHYLTLWHENFLGWPYYQPAPVGRAALVKGIHEKFTQTRTLETEISAKFVQVTGDVAIIQYAVKSVYTDREGKKQTDNLRIAHTWLKTSSGWKILGGMSTKMEPAGNGK